MPYFKTTTNCFEVRHFRLRTLKVCLPYRVWRNIMINTVFIVIKKGWWFCARLGQRFITGGRSALPFMLVNKDGAPYTVLGFSKGCFFRSPFFTIPGLTSRRPICAVWNPTRSASLVSSTPGSTASGGRHECWSRRRQLDPQSNRAAREVTDALDRCNLETGRPVGR